MKELYPMIDPYASGYIEADSTHTLYWEQCGNPEGVPIIVLHGGPGAAAGQRFRRFFDPEHYRIIILHQRGSGKSEPLAEIKDNTPEALVNDLETLRTHLQIDRWHLYGGSWGSTLALFYAIAYPERCISMILYSIFLLQSRDIEWFMEGTQHIFPDKWERFSSFLPKQERAEILSSYYARLVHTDPKIHLPAARVWAQYEEECCIDTIPLDAEPIDDNMALSIARLEAHYFIHHRIEDDNSLLKKINKIRHIPATIIQGRYDIVTPIHTAYDLHKAWPEADFVVVPEGNHGSSQPDMIHRLIQATDNARSIK